MTGYRRRFVAYNMGLIGFVLLAAFIALGISQYRSQINELQKTMSLVAEPWDQMGGSLRPIHDGRADDELPGGEKPAEPPDGEKPGEPPDGEKPGEPPDGEKPYRDKPDRRMTNDDIMTVFYDADSGSVSVLSNRLNMDETTLRECVAEIIAAEKNFGTLPARSLIYSKDTGGGGYKIALADTAYITSRTIRNALLLAAVFIGAMALLLPISIGLSKLAAKPMERAMDMERQFVQDISHDLKTPVTVVLANNSILRSDPNATVAEQQQWIDSTDEAAKNMMQLVNEMLTLSQLEAAGEGGRGAKNRPALCPVNLSQCAEKCVLQMESVAYDRGVTLESAIADGITALGDAAGVEKIMSGLIENALKYEPDGGRVDVALTRNRKKARFNVANNGSVIAEEDLPHIFERFYRGDKARSEKGHGLGLPILKGTAELMGAEISVASNKESGTVFTVSFDTTEPEK